MEGLMGITTVTSREFNQDSGRAKKAAEHGPVFITDRGKPSHVLLSIAEYRQLAGRRRSLAEALAMPGAADIELEIPRSRELPRAADLS
jgi:prevent-host-death family protein